MSLLEQTLNKVDKNKFMSYLCQNYPECFETPQVICDIHEVSKVILERFGSEVALKIAIKVLLENGKMNFFSTVIAFKLFLTEKSVNSGISSDKGTKFMNVIE